MISKKIPAYIYERHNIVRLIILTAVFALVFINIYKPFSSIDWYPVSEFKFFIFSSLIILTGVLVVVISRIIMYYFAKNHRITVGGYSLWILAEIFFMSTFYTIYTMVLNPERDWLHVFKESSINTALVLLLPYFILHLYFSYRDSNRRLKMMEESQAETHIKPKLYAFYDEKGEMRLSINRDNLLYIESADNYVYIWYLNKGNLTKFMLRNSMKAIEEQLSNTNVLRCHRSYIVNFEQVKVIRRQKDGIYIEFSTDNLPDIPISKKYSEKVTRWFLEYSE